MTSASQTVVSGEQPVSLNGDVSELLGKPGQGNLPAWLNPEAFLEPNFQPEACVGQLRCHVPLNTLQAELQSYLKYLRAKLSDVINEDYSDYVSLSSRLTNVDGAVMRMRRPLLELQARMVAVLDMVRGELSSLNQGLRRRKEVATARSLLELLQEMAHVASKVEKLLAEVAAADAAAAAAAAAQAGAAAIGGAAQGSSSSAAAAAADMDTRARLLERVAGEVSRLAYQANRGKDLAFARAMEPRITAARQELHSRLATALQAALTGGAHSAALHCLHAYAELGEAAPAEEAVRKLVVAPVVERVLQEHKAAHPARGAAVSVAGGRDDSFRQLLNKVLEQVKEQAGQLLAASLTPQSPLRTFDFLGNALLAEVNDALGTHLPGVFSPGVPAAFHTNYQAALDFLDALEQQCRGRTALERLRNGPAYAAFMRRWNVSVYFSLLLQDIAGTLEDSLPSERPPELAAGTPQGPAGVVLAASSALVACLAKVTSPEVFIRQAADRFLRVALQLGARYTSWLTGLAAARSAAATQAAAATQPSSLASQASSLLAGNTASGASSTTPATTAQATTLPSAAASQSAAWVTSLSTDELGVLVGDAWALAVHIRSTVGTTFVDLMKDLPAEAAALVQEAVNGVADGLQEQASALLACMASEVVESCVGVVKQLRGITAAYRVTSKGPPTRYSHYAASALVPLKSLLDSPRVARLDPTARAQLTAAVLDAVNARYQVLAEDLLTTVRKTEASLKKLKKAQADAGDGMSDSDKVSLQLQLDVQEHGVQIAKFGVVPNELPSYLCLLQAVAPAAAAAVGQASTSTGSAATSTHVLSNSAPPRAVTGDAPHQADASSLGGHQVPVIPAISAPLGTPGQDASSGGSPGDNINKDGDEGGLL